MLHIVHSEAVCNLSEGGADFRNAVSIISVPSPPRPPDSAPPTLINKRP
jgi:hypothetical protein